AAGRVAAVAEAHAALQRSPDLRRADAGAMIADLCDFVGRLDPAVRVSCTRQGEATLDVDRAIPLGLVVTELLTNAVRHAYPEGRGGAVRVHVVASGAGVEVTVEDDGIGVAGEADKGSLGRELVRSLSARIGAEIESRSEPGRGTRVCLRLPAMPANDAAAPVAVTA
ncbi:ATP-binding protein, partial [Falsiroseomonas oryziterrae]|uniref:ATP-binding protein n=1 Tax=Falsiroseomonas oryziterrae TaxID=2911368 RepID=UPI001F22BCC5